MTEVEFLDTADDSLLKFAVIISRYQGKWLFCKHRERDTYECPGGHREPGEAIEDTARRELYEETGAVSFTLTPVSAYSVHEAFDGLEAPAISCGMLYYGCITELGPIPEGYEIERTELFRDPPGNWTYPDIQPVLLGYLETWLCRPGQDGANGGERVSDGHVR